MSVTEVGFSGAVDLRDLDGNITIFIMDHQLLGLTKVQNRYAWDVDCMHL